ncbi:response regulator [Herbaspirillum sp. 1130]|uniref:LytR/AlgR family response regulator transcription factor n=1 Tax=Herbaspirillum sp. 1130 TaxID=2806562 RepID=UPI001AE16320|nr:response regulator [Herbaspirillum sp. 1130]MBP1314183.1 two-component system LytT family response regulator [Herbaspirillum sp. 1130]
MRVMIVDDEAPARTKLARMLAAFADVEISGQAADGRQAIDLAAELQPDVIFLDVQMPEVGGFDVAASLPDNGPALVFVTAYDQFALRAFDTHAIDYLLKPVEPLRLERTIARLRQATQPSGLSLTVPVRLVVTERGQHHVIECRQITWLESADNYVQLHVGSRAFLLRRTLASILDDLETNFVRIHRRIAVATAMVESVEQRAKGDALVHLKDGTQLPCSRSYREALLARLGQ